MTEGYLQIDWLGAADGEKQFYQGEVRFSGRQRTLPGVWLGAAGSPAAFRASITLLTLPNSSSIIDSVTIRSHVT